MLDEALYIWFAQKRSQGVPISGPILITSKALELNQRLNPSDQAFKASSGWLSRFKSRHGIRQLSIQREKMSADTDCVSDFKKTLSEFIEKEQLTLNQVYNCDETGLYWKALPSKTLASQKEKTTPGYKVHKERVTILACANATGDHKLKFTMIGKAKKPRALKDLNPRALPLKYMGQTNAWMDCDWFQEWFDKEFVPEVKKYLKERNLPIRGLLLTDNAPCHPCPDVLKSPSNRGIKCLFLPPNTTSLIQPMDQGVLECMKRRYRKELLKKLLLADAGTIDPENTIIDFWKRINIKDAIFMVAAAWNDVPGTTIRASWRKLYKFNDETSTALHDADCQGSSTNPTSTDQPEPIHLPPVEDFLHSLSRIHGCNECDITDVQEWIEMDSGDQGYELLNDE